jgi:hypothetical protein
MELRVRLQRARQEIAFIQAGLRKGLPIEECRRVVSMVLNKGEMVEFPDEVILTDWEPCLLAPTGWTREGGKRSWVHAGGSMN